MPVSTAEKEAEDNAIHTHPLLRMSDYSGQFAQLAKSLRVDFPASREISELMRGIRVPTLDLGKAIAEAIEARTHADLTVDRANQPD